MEMKPVELVFRFPTLPPIALHAKIVWHEWGVPRIQWLEHPERWHVANWQQASEELEDELRSMFSAMRCLGLFGKAVADGSRAKSWATNNRKHSSSAGH